MFIVFLATGFWHGASWNFVVWGLYHGFFMIMERLFLGRWLEKNNLKIIDNLYTLFVVVVGWVFFRADNLSYAVDYLKAMFLPADSFVYYGLGYYLTPACIIALVVAVLISGPIQQVMANNSLTKFEKSPSLRLCSGYVGIVVLIFCIVSLASGTYNPFIYFRF